jgi:MoxR-like ATPase
MNIEIIHGPPGCGKTRRAEMSGEGMSQVYYLCHAWTDADELFVGVDVAAAVAGDAAAVRQDGVLTQAARLSQSGPVNLIIDEIDKAPERAECLLLDFLQSGRAQVAPGRHVQADRRNLQVRLTSNGVREIGEPLLRRCRRVWMDPLSQDTVRQIAAAQTDAPVGVITTLAKAAWDVAAHEGRDHVTVAEFTPLCREVMAAGDITEVRQALAGWAARTRKGADYVRTAGTVPAVWSELKQSRGR